MGKGSPADVRPQLDGYREDCRSILLYPDTHCSDEFCCSKGHISLFYVRALQNRYRDINFERDSSAWLPPCPAGASVSLC